MGLLSWLRGDPSPNADPEAEARTWQGGAFFPADYIAHPGVEVANTDEALRVSAVWACVNLIANHVATMPFEAYRRDTDGVPRIVAPRPTLLDRPHPALNRVDWLTMVMASLLLRGNAYLGVIARDTMGRPTALLPLDPSIVDVKAVAGWPVYTVNGNETDAYDLVHIRGLTLPGQFKGLSVIDAARTTMGATIATDRFASQYFSEGLAPSGVLETVDDLDPADADNLARMFESRHGRSRKPLVLTAGMTWKPLSVSPEESQFLATREFQVHDVARLFGVPGHMINATDKTTSFGAGIQALNTSFHVLAVQPWLVRLETALTDQLPRSQYVKAVVASMLRGTITERYAAYEVAQRIGLMCTDEQRALEDLPPLPDGKGQIFYVSAQLVPAGDDPTVEGNPDDTDGLLDSEANHPDGEGDGVLPTGPNGVAPGPDGGNMADPLVGSEAPNTSD